MRGRVKSKSIHSTDTLREPPHPARSPRYNYETKEMGDVISFVGTYRASRGQAAAVTFYTFVGAWCAWLRFTWQQHESQPWERRHLAPTPPCLHLQRYMRVAPTHSPRMHGCTAAGWMPAQPWCRFQQQQLGALDRGVFGGHAAAPHAHTRH